jgi:hypothetical protein
MSKMEILTLWTVVESDPCIEGAPPPFHRMFGHTFPGHGRLHSLYKSRGYFQ